MTPIIILIVISFVWLIVGYSFSRYVVGENNCTPLSR